MTANVGIQPSKSIMEVNTNAVIMQLRIHNRNCCTMLSVTKVADSQHCPRTVGATFFLALVREMLPNSNGKIFRTRMSSCPHSSAARRTC